MGVSTPLRPTSPVSDHLIHLFARLCRLHGSQTDGLGMGEIDSIGAEWFAILPPEEAIYLLCLRSQPSPILIG